MAGALCLAHGAAHAQPSEAAVKAAFLTKFPAYLSFPISARPRAGSPFSICVVGRDPFGRLIDDVARGQQIGGQPVRVRRLTRPAEAAGCQIAFVQGAAPSATGALLQRFAGKPTLTVTDSRAGGQQGMIHFTVNQGRVRFHIDEAAARRSGIDINSRLLGLALSVKRAQ